MAGNTFGKLFTVTTFGESHGEALGLIIDGVPSGITLDEAFIQSEMDRRKPGKSPLATARREGDRIRILSGVLNGITTGTPLAMIVFNENQHSSDYTAIEHLFRPGHADYTYFSKYGLRDARGGGRSSGRETLCRVAAGAVAKLCLKEKGIRITAATVQAGCEKAAPFIWAAPYDNDLCAPDKDYERMKKAIEAARAEEDSLGGVIEIHIDGVPAGLGEPCFEKLDARLAAALFSVGAVKGVEVGAGFAAAAMRGSENNDEMRMEDGRPVFLTNNAGGILGGISNGNTIILKAAIKPTPSIAKEQRTVNEDGEEVAIRIKGRHDPSIVPRAVVVLEAMCALTVLDEYLIRRAYE
jgi:chorismate synthase